MINNLDTTTTTAPTTAPEAIQDLFSTKVLSNELFNDINNVCKQDPKYKGIYLTSYLFSLFGYFGSNKIYLKTGNWDAITSKSGMLIVGSSQDGKTVAGDLILNPLRNIQTNNVNANLIIDKYEEACKKFVYSEYYLGLNEIQQATAKEKFAGTFNDNYVLGNKLGLEYLEFGEKQEKRPAYIFSDFNLQVLSTAYAMNAKNTVICQTDEFGTLIDMFNNGLNPTDKYEYILSSIDGKNITVWRKTQDPIISEGSATVITCTTHQKFSAIKKTLFAGGLGNRLFYVITPVNEQELRIASFASNNNSIAEFKAKIEDKTQQLINKIQSGSNQTLCINTEANLSLYNELSTAIWNEYNTEELRTLTGSDTANGMFGRFHLNLQQCILNFFLVNKFWVNTNVQDPEYFTLTGEDIKRGAEAYRYFLSTMLSIHTRPQATKASSKQQQFIDLFAVGETVIHKEFFVRGETVMSGRGLRDFMQMPAFNEFFESNKSMGIQSYRRVK